MKGTIRQRNPGSWEIQVFLGRDANGKRIRKTETVRGKKSDGQRRLREILAELDRGITPTKVQYKVGEWLDKWLQEKIIPNRRQKTIDRYEGIIRLHIKPSLEHVGLVQLSPMHIQGLESKLLDEGMAPKGVQAVHHVLSGAVKHALRMEMIFRDPVALVSPPTVARTEAYSPEMDDVLALLSLAEKAENPLWPFIHLIAFTGMRRGEALALTGEHIDLDEGTLQICQSLVVTADGVSLEPPKTARGERTVALDALTVGVLRKHRAQQEELAGQLGVEPPAIVFPRREWTGWSHPNTVMHAVQRLAKRAGCPSVTLRSLRHFHASVLLDVRPNYAVAAERLGHSSPKITMDIYAHALEGWQQEAADAFANAMQPAA